MLISCTRNNATGLSPYYLMFGCKLDLPIDLIFGTNLKDLKGNHTTYIENLKKRMAWAHETTDIIQKEQERSKQHYDCKIQCTKLMIGDKVLL